MVWGNVPMAAGSHRGPCFQRKNIEERGLCSHILHICEVSLSAPPGQRLAEVDDESLARLPRHPLKGGSSSQWKNASLASLLRVDRSRGSTERRGNHGRKRALLPVGHKAVGGHLCALDRRNFDSQLVHVKASSFPVRAMEPPLQSLRRPVKAKETHETHSLGLFSPFLGFPLLGRRRL